MSKKSQEAGRKKSRDPTDFKWGENASPKCARRSRREDCYRGEPRMLAKLPASSLFANDAMKRNYFVAINFQISREK